jgi:hypothetical protein
MALDWLSVIIKPAAFTFLIINYEDFSANPRAAISQILHFFGHQVEPVLPSVEGEKSGGIHLLTHYRRGRVGSYREEAPPDLRAELDRRVHPVLARVPPW